MDVVTGTAPTTAAAVPAGAIPAQRAPGDGPGVPPRTPRTPACRCGHARDVHEHYRAGTDCGICGAGCRAFRA